MKVRIHTTKQRRGTLGSRRLILILAILSTSCACLSWPDGPGLDNIREDITLEEARKLAPFPICVPVYIPTGVRATPNVTYHADFGDAMESDIRLRYYSLDGQDLMIEIYQRHRPDALTPDDITKKIQDHYVQELIAWQVERDTEWSEIEAMSEQVSVSVTSYQDSNTNRWLYEITEPDSLRANLIDWGNDPVTYLVYTHLSVESAKEVVRSLPDVSECE